MERDTQNKFFNLAVEFICYSNQSLFLTGRAGTGKTTFLKYIREHCQKKMVITAPTGVAAINAGGVTLHSFFQLPFGTYLPEMSSGWDTGSQNFYNKKQLLSKLHLRQSRREVIQSLELLVIDEISMVRADLLDAIDTVLRFIRRKPLEPFGGVQLLLIGDLFQLPPVVTQEESERLYDYYRSPFFFDAKVMREKQLLTLTLQKIYRQQDPEFIRLLNRVRNNSCEEDDFVFLNHFYQPSFVPNDQDGFITLTTHNKIASQLNASALERLPGKLTEISASIEEEFPENAYPADHILRLKKGAQIMFIKNDAGENRRYFNGKIGIIESLDAGSKSIEISFPGESDKIKITPETWNNIRYEYDKEKDEVKEKTLGSFSQFPIRLAWAVTIHKSQGLTFDKAVIDAGRSFAPGQVYVALSRLTGLSGLVLHSRIARESIRTDTRIEAFIKEELQTDDYELALNQAQKDYANQLLLSAYNWENIETVFAMHYQRLQSKAIPDKETALRKTSSWLDLQIELSGTAQKFQRTLEKLLNEGNFLKIEERNKAASIWFTGQLNTIIGGIKKQISDQDGKTRIKKYVQELQELVRLLERKKALLERSHGLTSALSVTGELREAMHQFMTPVVTPVEQPKSGSGKVDSKRISLELFLSGKSISEIAQERNLAVSTITGHLTTFIPTKEISYKIFITEAEAKEIIQKAKELKGFTLGKLKEELGNRFDYSQLKAAVALLDNKIDL